MITRFAYILLTVSLTGSLFGGSVPLAYGASFDQFGSSVSDNLIVVGAPDDDDHGRDSGSVNVFNTDGTLDRNLTFIRHFGTHRGQRDSVELTARSELEAPSILTPLPEDEGSIPLATELELVPGEAVNLDAMIGDGPYGSGGTRSGDVDFYAIRNVRQKQLITVDIYTPIPDGLRAPTVRIYDSAGSEVGLTRTRRLHNDKDPKQFRDQFNAFIAPVADDYFVAVSGFGTYLEDRFDSSSGRLNLLNDEGAYNVTIGLEYSDNHDFIFFLRPGDVIGASTDNPLTLLSLADRTGTERQGSGQGIEGPDASPLPDGLATVAHVVDIPGPFRLRVQRLKSGDFTLRLKAALPPLRTAGRGAFQTIFLDFDGETGEWPLSPLSRYLPNWGLTAADEDRVIDAIVHFVKLTLVKDVRRFGRNPRFGIRLLNSRDHDDPWGQEHVSRVIVGGTRNELNTNVIAIADSLDTGNFDTTETAYVLLDTLSDTNPDVSSSLNNVPRDPSASIVDLIGVGVGQIVVHQAGHLLGNRHTNRRNDRLNIMDANTHGFFSFLGLGADGIFGTRDDVPVRFGRDEFEPTEGFTGVQDTRNTVAFGAPRGRR